MTLQLKICSTVLRSLQHLAWVAGQAYGPAVLALSEASLLWWGITSDLVHSGGNFSVPRSSGLDLLVLLLFLPRSIPLLISSEGMSSIPGHLHVFTSASTSPSILVDCPHFQWRTGWFLVWSRRRLVHSCTRHRSIMHTS